jgi:hypothetical protein
MVSLETRANGEPSGSSSSSSSEPSAAIFGFLEFIFDMVEGKLRPTAEDEPTGEADWMLVVADEGREAETAIAA